MRNASFMKDYLTCIVSSQGTYILLSEPRRRRIFKSALLQIQKVTM